MVLMRNDRAFTAEDPLSSDAPVGRRSRYRDRKFVVFKGAVPPASSGVLLLYGAAQAYFTP
jgi:hypothetical protein